MGATLLFKVRIDASFLICPVLELARVRDRGQERAEWASTLVFNLNRAAGVRQRAGRF
jgi:hypothetical protein